MYKQLNVFKNNIIAFYLVKNYRKTKETTCVTGCDIW